MHHSKSQSFAAEINNHVAECADENNLKLNRAKYVDNDNNNTDSYACLT